MHWVSCLVPSRLSFSCSQCQVRIFFQVPLFPNQTFNDFHFFLEVYEAYRKAQNEILTSNPPTIPDKLFYMKQYVHNTCGTMALIHSVLNNLDVAEMKDGSVIKNFFDKANPLTPEERGKLFNADTAFVETHQALAAEGQTEAPASDAKVDKHFISFVNVGNELFELDGSLRDCPVSHGTTDADKFLTDAARICKEFMARDPKDPNFTIMAYAKAQ